MNAEPGPEPTGEPDDSPVDVIVVGGGIGGIYCARELAGHGLSVKLLEMRPYLGGRIETLDLRGFAGPTALARRPVFKAECGPMRFELALQPRFVELCEQLGITLADFPAPNAPQAPTPYPLAADEQPGGRPLDALQLLRMGVFRMFGQDTTIDAEGTVVPTDEQWLVGLDDDRPNGFEHLRMTARLRGTGEPLYKLGFWNALRQVISHGAVETIKDRGTFFHLLPENPSAVEWGIFWLRIFKLPKGGKLHGIPGGTRLLTERLEAELDTKWQQQVRVLRNHQAVGIHEVDNGLVEIAAISRTRGARRKSVHTAPHVILALPRKPLERFAPAFPDQIARDLEAAAGFRLLKAFLCMRRPPWWGPNVPTAQTGAWTFPTREVHYFEDESGDNAMAMLYSDEPNARYWTTFIEDPPRHDRAQVNGNQELKHELVRLILEQQRMAAAAQLEGPLKPGHHDGDTFAVLKEIVARLPGLDDPSSFSEAPPSALDVYADPDAFGIDLFASVSDYAIRDWECPPDGAGCHAWASGSRSWEVRARLRAFPLRDGLGEPNIHICGEAYSDYQGFIEGALRSAADAVATITGDKPPHSA